MIFELESGLFRGHPNGRVIKTVLNLETQTRELIWGDPNKEFRDAVENKIIYFDMAWSGIFPPKEEDVIVALSIIKTAPRPLYFHCRADRERTGFLAAVYRMQVHRWTFNMAYNEWIGLGCRWPTYWLWKKALKKYELW